MNIILFSVKGESLPGGVLGPFQNCPVFPCSHTFSLFVPLLINLLTTYYRPQFPPAKTKDTKNKTSICVTSSQAFERNSHKLVKICPLPCSSWSSECDICLFLVFPYKFPSFFDGDWFYMTDHVRLTMYINSFSVISIILSLTKRPSKNRVCP